MPILILNPKFYTKIMVAEREKNTTADKLNLFYIIMPHRGTSIKLQNNTDDDFKIYKMTNMYGIIYNDLALHFHSNCENICMYI